ncbi:hypothetical protein BHM03_00030709 [Ensete ventricosum]|nr:hypothetical protein BHM03_00030709 [Ensete ventricosum]
MDAKALRDLEVKKTCHDFDLTATEGSLAAIRERYSISEEYALHVLLPRQEMTKLWLVEAGLSLMSREPSFLYPKLMKELCEMTVCKNDERFYALHMSDLPPRDLESEMRARWEALKNSARVWDDPQMTTEFKMVILHPHLAKELNSLSSEELNEVRGDLFEAQKQLKELPAKGCKVDDNLLKAVRELDTQQVELPKQAIKDYKWTTEFKLGL